MFIYIIGKNRHFAFPETFCTELVIEVTQAVLPPGEVIISTTYW
jgi:hypothetical protein